MRSMAMSCPRWCEVWVMRRVMTHARAMHIEERCVFLPPRFERLAQSSQTLAAVLGIALHELQTGFSLWQEWRAHVDPQHVAKPEILTHTLVHHLFVHAAPSRVGLLR